MTGNEISNKTIGIAFFELKTDFSIFNKIKQGELECLIK